MQLNKKSNLKLSALGLLLALPLTAAARGLDLNIAGDVNIYAAQASNKHAFDFTNPTVLDPINEAADKSFNRSLVTDTVLKFDVFMGLDGGGSNRLGGFIALEADTSLNKYQMPQVYFGNGGTVSLFEVDQYTITPVTSIMSRSTNAREAYVYASGQYGKIELGNTYGVTQKLKVSAADVAANGGINNDARYFYSAAPLFGNLTTDSLVTNKTSFYHLDDLFLPLEDAQPFTQDLAVAPKISYYTPEYAGFILGLGFTRDTDHNGGFASYYKNGQVSSTHGFGFENVIELAINYQYLAGNSGMQFYLGGETGKAKQKGIFTAAREGAPTNTIYKNLRGYEAGFLFEMKGLGLGASYGMNKALISSMKNNNYYTLGIGYAFSDLKVSINYIKNSQDSLAYQNASAQYGKIKAGFNAYYLDAAYSITPGANLFANYTHFKATRPLNTGTDERKKLTNSGTVFMGGLRLNF